MKDFAVINFSYPKSNPENPYAVGLVIIMDGFILQKFHSYIQLSDPLDINSPQTIKQRCKLSPTFGLVERTIGELVLNLPLVTHDSNITKKAFKKFHEEMGLPVPYAVENIIDTYSMTGLSLKESCERYGFIMSSQDDPLEKAKDCAKLYLKLSEE